MSKFLWQRLGARQPDTDLSKLNARQSDFLLNFDEKAHTNVLEIVDICLKLPSNSEYKYSQFCFV